MSVTISGIRSTSTFNVSNGGTGNNTLSSGSLLIGNNTDPVAFIAPGSEGQVLTVVNGEWSAADAPAGSGGTGGGLSSITTSGNLQGNGTAGSPATLKANISLTSVTASFSGSGAGLSNIPNSALQNNYIDINGTQVPLGGNYMISFPQSSGISSVHVSGSGLSGSGLPGDPLFLDNIPNNKLANSSITINGQSVSLGGNVSIQTSSDTSIKVFTATGLSVGQVVALSGSLVAADKSNDLKSNAIGVVTVVAGTDVTVKLFGEASTNGASSYAAIGTPVYVGSNGAVTNYAGLSAGNYVTQVGFISDTGKIIIQPRIFGQL